MASNNAKAKIRRALKSSLNSLSQEQLIEIILRLTEANYDESKFAGISTTIDHEVGRVREVIQEVAAKKGEQQ